MKIAPPEGRKKRLDRLINGRTRLKLTTIDALTLARGLVQEVCRCHGLPDTREALFALRQLTRRAACKDPRTGRLPRGNLRYITKAETPGLVRRAWEILDQIAVIERLLASHPDQRTNALIGGASVALGYLINDFTATFPAMRSRKPTARDLAFECFQQSKGAARHIDILEYIQRRIPDYDPPSYAALFSKWKRLDCWETKLEKKV